MAKVLSARLDETVVDELERLSKRVGLSKKQLIEEAIRLRVARDRQGAAADVWAETCGAWRRRESPQRTIRRARETLEAAVTRRHRRATDA